MTPVRAPRPLLGARRSTVLAAAMVALAASSLSAGAVSAGAAAPELVPVVSARYPVSGGVTSSVHEQSALRPAAALNDSPAAPALVDGAPHKWRDLGTTSGVIMDLDFVSAKVGYAAAELGVIWKTVNGGRTWEQLVDVGFPYYFYGVEALSADEVVVSGFDNTAGLDESALVWRTTDGGDTWSSDIDMGPGWAGRVRYADDQHGLIGGLIGSTMWHTETGGESEDEWTYEQPDPADGWFGNQFTLLPSLRAYASGISFCRSPNGGVDWSCEHSVDDVVDGPTSFFDKATGWVGGGTISPSVEGWVHRTTDGGDTWSDRVLDTGYPIRQIEPLDRDNVWAAGGSGFDGVGGISYSADGGTSWSQDLSTGTEITSCDHRAVHHRTADRIWCVGWSGDGGYHSDVYQLTVHRR